jgi:hypothetical protein
LSKVNNKIVVNIKQRFSVSSWMYVRAKYFQTRWRVIAIFELDTLFVVAMRHRELVGASRGIPCRRKEDARNVRGELGSHIRVSI